MVVVGVEGLRWSLVVPSEGPPMLFGDLGIRDMASSFLRWKREKSLYSRRRVEVGRCFGVASSSLGMVLFALIYRIFSRLQRGGKKIWFDQLTSWRPHLPVISNKSVKTSVPESHCPR